MADQGVQDRRDWKIARTTMRACYCGGKSIMKASWCCSPRRQCREPWGPDHAWNEGRKQALKQAAVRNTSSSSKAGPSVGPAPASAPVTAGADLTAAGIAVTYQPALAALRRTGATVDGHAVESAAIHSTPSAEGEATGTAAVQLAAPRQRPPQGRPPQRGSSSSSSSGTASW